MRALHVHLVPPQHALQEKAAAASAAGLPEDHLGSAVESLLDDQLDEQQVPSVEAYRRAATTKSSAYDY